MTILLLGGTGQVGTALLRLAADAGLAIVAPKRGELDLTRQGNIVSVFEGANPDIVINAAAYTAVDKAESEIDAAFAANRDGPARLADSCRSTGIPLLHVSTDYVFDGTKNGGYSETDTPNPQGVYAESKRAGEDAIRSRLDDHVILRTSWVFGADGSNFPKTILRLAGDRPVLTIVDDQHGCPTPAEAIGAALLHLAGVIREKRGVFPWGTYHFAGGPPTTWFDLARAVIELGAHFGLIASSPEILPIPTSEYPTPAPRPANSVLDCSKWRATFDHPLPDWRNGLTTMLRETATGGPSAPSSKKAYP